LIGYEIGAGLVEAGRQAINASQQFDYFAGRLGKSAQDTQAFRNNINDLQKEFRKVNMTSVGATAMEIAVKNGLQGTNDELTEISRMTAVMSSTFKKEGRTEEDAILAVNDALDGQFRRLQEIGIKQEDLTKNGWNGDLNDKMGLVKALNKTMQEMGYEKTAKDITSLDDAWSALTVAGSKLIESVLIPMMPAIMSVLNGLTNMVSGFNDMPQWFKDLASYGVMAGAGILTVAYAASKLSGVLGGLQGFSGIFGKIFSTGGTTGGIAGGEAGGKGIVATLKGLKGFGRALISLVPDIIMASAAVAVIIAVVFALAAEVIVLVKGIQMLIDAMKFGDIDLTDDIEGLKKLGQAMWEIASIMGAMSIANVANIVTQASGGVLNLAVSLATIKDAYQKVVSAVKEISGMGDIDQGGLDKLKKMGEALKSLGEAATGLQQVNGGMNFGTAINNLVAMLTRGEADIGANIDALIAKINEIAPKLNSLTSLPDIDQSGVDKIKKFGEVMQSIGQAATSMQGIQGGVVGSFMDWWQGDIVSQVDKAIQAIQQIAPKLQGLAGIQIPDLSGVQRVGVGLSYVKSASDQLVAFGGFIIPPEAATNVGLAVNTIKQVATQLQGLQGTNVGDVATILTQIQTAIDQIKATLASANFNAEGVNIGTSLTSGVQSGLSGLPGVVNDAANNAVNTARGTLTSGMQSAGSDSVNSFRSGIEGMSDAMTNEMQQVTQAVQSGLDAAKQKASAGAAEIVQAFKNGSGINSPGYMYWAMFDEMGLINKILNTSASLLSQSAYTLGNKLTNAFNPNLSTGFNSNLNTNAVNGASGGGNTYYIGEGAFQVVVKDMTKKEAQGVIVEALESL
jgi:di/tripeptidase